MDLYYIVYPMPDRELSLKAIEGPHVLKVVFHKVLS